MTQRCSSSACASTNARSARASVVCMNGAARAATSRLVAAVLVALGGLVQINPIWQWGPYEINRATNGAQPDWYLGWLIGGLRLMLNIEIRIGGLTLVPNPFWGGAFFPMFVFGFATVYPFLERRLSRSRER